MLASDQFQTFNQAPYLTAAKPKITAFFKKAVFFCNTFTACLPGSYIKVYP